MIINGEEIDHLEVFDETGFLVACISDSEIITKTNYSVKECKTDRMFENG
jgi:hypothetical protein